MRAMRTIHSTVLRKACMTFFLLKAHLAYPAPALPSHTGCMAPEKDLRLYVVKGETKQINHLNSKWLIYG